MTPSRRLAAPTVTTERAILFRYRGGRVPAHRTVTGAGKERTGDTIAAARHRGPEGRP